MILLVAQIERCGNTSEIQVLVKCICSIEVYIEAYKATLLMCPTRPSVLLLGP